MTSPISIVVLQQLYQSTFVQNSCGLAVIALLLYDAVLGFDREVNFAWGSPTKGASLLYFCNRYIILIDHIFSSILIYPVSDTSCTVISWSSNILQVLVMLGPAAFTSLRVYALTRKHMLLSAFTLVLSLGPFLVNTSTLYSRIPINSGSPMNCAQASTLNPSVDIPLVFLSRGSLILADALAAAVTWRETYRSLEAYRTLRALETTSRRPSLLWVMFQNGSIYFCALVSINVLQMVLTVYAMRAQGATGTYATTFIDPVSSILNCRFLLDLRETTERLAGGSSESGLVSSLSFGGVASGAPGSRRGSGFVESFGGPVLPPLAPNSTAANECSLGTGTETGRD